MVELFDKDGTLKEGLLLMKKVLRENLIKNIVVLFFLILSYFALKPSLTNPVLALDKGAIGSVLVAVSILAVIASFGNFAFTYEEVEHKSFESRILAHLTTGLLMFLIGLSLEMTSLLSKLLLGSIPIFDLALIILYVASVLYDFWDLKRTQL